MKKKNIRDIIYKIIFKADTPAGKAFDLILIASILLSVGIVFLDSIPRYNQEYQDLFYNIEWFFTILFTIEYFMRIYCIKKPFNYMRSFFGIIDLLSIVPTYISILIPSTRFLGVIRILRVLRIFRILKLINYISEANVLMDAIVSSRRKITVFIFFLLAMVTIFGSIMYLIEGQENGFTSIPRSMYWAIVTITTVGYGDISPGTNLGQFISSFVMILGYATIAVPTGIISAEYTAMKQKFNSITCNECSSEDHDDDAQFCKACGATLD